MTTNDADRRLIAWLESAAPGREPDHLLAAVVEQTARTPRRPAWRIPERWMPMTTISTQAAAGRRMPWQLAVVAALLVLAVVAGAVLLAGGRPTQVLDPFGPAANGSIVYETGGNLAAVDAAGGGTSVIADAPGLEIVPVFAHDGSAIAFLRALDPEATEPEAFALVVAEADGSDARTLAEFESAGWPTWSPSGDRIAVETLVDGQSAIAMVDIATGNRTILDLGVEAEFPAFRPGHDQIAFRGRVDGGPWGLYLAGADGSDVTRLNLDPGFQDDVTYDINADFYFNAPTWSPDGDRLAYHTLETFSASDPGFRVHVAEIDAGGVVTAEETLMSPPGVDDQFEAAWLPDGSGLVTHQLDGSRHALVRWAVAAGLATPAVATSLDLGEVSGEIFDLRFIVSPDGTEVLAWQPGQAARRVPVSGAPGTPTDLVLEDAAAWQRTAS